MLNVELASLPAVCRRYRYLPLLGLRNKEAKLSREEALRLIKMSPFDLRSPQAVPELVALEEEVGTVGAVLAGGLAVSRYCEINPANLVEGYELFWDLAGTLGIEWGGMDLSALDERLTPYLRWFDTENCDPFVALNNLRVRIKGGNKNIGNCVVQGWLYALFSLLAGLKVGEVHCSDGSNHSVPFFPTDTDEVVLWDYDLKHEKYGLWRYTPESLPSPLLEDPPPFVLSGPFSFIASLINNRFSGYGYVLCTTAEHRNNLAVMQNAQGINPSYLRLFFYLRIAYERLGMLAEAASVKRETDAVRKLNFQYSHDHCSVIYEGRDIADLGKSSESLV